MKSFKDLLMTSSRNEETDDSPSPPQDDASQAKAKAAAQSQANFKAAKLKLRKSRDKLIKKSADSKKKSLQKQKQAKAGRERDMIKRQAQIKQAQTPPPAPPKKNEDVSFSSSSGRAPKIMKSFKELRAMDEGTNARQRGEVQSPRSPEEYDALSPADKKIVDKRTKNARKQGMSRQPGESPRNKRTKRKPRNHRNRKKTALATNEAWGSTNPKVPFDGEYEVEFVPNSVTGRSAFYVDHDEGDKEGRIYVKTDYKGKGDTNVDERKFIASLKNHLAAARKAGERVNVEVHEIGNMGFKSDRSRR
jgi:hypothetical protein